MWPRTALGIYDDEQGGDSDDEAEDSGEGGMPIDPAGSRAGEQRQRTRGDRRTERAAALGLRARQRWEAAWAKRQRMQGMQGKRTCGEGAEDG